MRWTLRVSPAQAQAQGWDWEEQTLTSGGPQSRLTGLPWEHYLWWESAAAAWRKGPLAAVTLALPISCVISIMSGTQDSQTSNTRACPGHSAAELLCTPGHS